MIQARIRLLPIVGRGLAVLGLAAAFMFATVAGSSAQVLRDVLKGAGLGAIIGGIAGGGKGAGKGAIAGGIAGAIIGEIARDGHAEPPHHPPPPPPHYVAPPPQHYTAVPATPRAPTHSPRSVSNHLVRDIQQSLHNLGYQPGPVDGHSGTQTERAISTYQGDYNLLVDGHASAQLLAHMRSHGG